MSRMSRKKQQDGSLKTLRDLLAQPGNKKCLECDQRGPTYVDITIGSFVCTSCGGMLRGLNPPHRVKSISMTNFTPAEITFMENHGNEWCRAVYLAKYDEQSGAKPDSKGDTNKLKHFMELKYEQKRWYESPTHQRKLMESVKAKRAAENSKASSRPVNNTSQEKLKPISAPAQQSATNLLDGIAFPSQPAAAAFPIQSSAFPSQQPDAFSSQPAVASNTSVPNSTSGSFPGFADFDKAFAELSTSQNNAAHQPDPFSAFQVSSQPIDFTNATSKSATAVSSTTSTQNKSVDKYAALLDLDMSFNKPEDSANKNESFFSMPTNSAPVAGLNQPTNMSQYAGMPVQQMPNSAFSTNTNLSGFAQPAPVTSTSNYGNPVNWNASIPNLSYPMNPPATSATNPFFSNTPPPQAPNMQNWSNQFQMQPQTRPMNPSGLPSTNPFNIGGPAAPAGNAFNMSQASNPMQNSSNPFLFS